MDYEELKEILLRQLWTFTHTDDKMSMFIGCSKRFSFGEANSIIVGTDEHMTWSSITYFSIDALISYSKKVIQEYLGNNIDNYIIMDGPISSLSASINIFKRDRIKESEICGYKAGIMDVCITFINNHCTRLYNMPLAKLRGIYKSLNFKPGNIYNNLNLSTKNIDIQISSFNEKIKSLESEIKVYNDAKTDIKEWLESLDDAEKLAGELGNG